MMQFFKKKFPKEYQPQTEVGINIRKIVEILTKIEEMKRNKREEERKKQGKDSTANQINAQ
jgi:hypothetical protein